MALVVGTNSYVDLSTAESYAADRAGTLDWLELDSETKEQSLVSASDFLDTIGWIGTATVSTQAMAWPRDGEYFDPFVGDTVILNNDIPASILEAQIELALQIGVSGSLSSSSSSGSGTPDDIVIGSIELRGLKESVEDETTLRGVSIPTTVLNLVRPLLATASGSNTGGLFRPTWRAW